MKKSIAIITASLALLLAGGAALPATSQASSIANAPQTDKFQWVIAGQVGSNLKLVSSHVVLTITGDDPTQFDEVSNNPGNDVANMKKLDYVPASKGGLKYSKGDRVDAAKYIAVDGTHQGQYFYLVNREDFPNTKIWFIDDNNKLFDETTFAKAGNDLAAGLDAINNSLK